MKDFFFKLSEDYLPSEEEFRKVYNSLSFMDKIHFREEYTSKFSWSVITQEVVREIKDATKELKVLEVAAGSGYLAKHLQNAGIDVLPTNLSDSDWKVNQISFTNVKNMDAIEAVNNIEFDIVLFSWCQYGSSLAAEVFKRLKNGQRYIHIGEGWGGCTATDEFFELISEHKSEPSYLFNFDGIRDYMEIIEKG